MTLSELAQLVYEDYNLGMNEDFLFQVRTKSAEEFACAAHFGLGLSIRNRYRLWDEDSKYYIKDTGGVSMHPDDVSHEVLLKLHQCATRIPEN